MSRVEQSERAARGPYGHLPGTDLWGEDGQSRRRFEPDDATLLARYPELASGRYAIVEFMASVRRMAVDRCGAGREAVLDSELSALSGWQLGGGS